MIDLILIPLAGTKARGRRFETRDSDATNGIQVTLDYSNLELGTLYFTCYESFGIDGSRQTTVHRISVGQPCFGDEQQLTL